MALRDWLPFRRKDNPVSDLIVLGLYGPRQEIPPKTSLIAQANDGYQRNVTVNSCINLIARSSAAVPWVLFSKQPGMVGAKHRGTKARKIMSFRTYAKASTGRWHSKASADTSEVDNHPLLKLIEQPNPMQGGAEYLEEVLSFLHIAGNSFETWVGPDTGPNRGRPTEMWSLRVDRLRILGGLIGSGRTVYSFRYYAGANFVDFDPSIVLHQKFFHPLDDFWGLSPIQVAALVVEGDNAAALWNKKLLENDARPSTAMVVKGGIADPAVRDRLKAELQERYAGAQNARRPMLLEGDLDMKVLGLSPADLDWINGRKMNRHEIAQVYNVPPGLVDPELMSYASAEQDRKKLYQENVCPLLDRRRDNLNNSIAKAFGDTLYLDYDRDQIDALHEDSQKLYQGLRQADWLTTNEKRAATGYDDYTGEPDTDPVGDIPVMFMKPSQVPGAPEDTAQPGAGAAPVTGVPGEGNPTASSGNNDGSPGAKAHDYSRAQKQATANMEKRVRTLFKRQQRDLVDHLKTQLEKLR
jgi:HK97 family phage portal protein